MAIGAKKGLKCWLDVVFAQNTRIWTHPHQNSTTHQHISSRGHLVEEVPQVSSKPSLPIPLKPYQPVLGPPNDTALEVEVDDMVDPSQQVHDPGELEEEQTEVSKIILFLTRTN